MITGIERLRRAREILDQPGQQPTEVEPLVDAACECWAAAIDAASWPLELRLHAATVQRAMFRYGGIRASIERMEEAERLQLRRELLDFAQAVERTNTSYELT